MMKLEVDEAELPDIVRFLDAGTELGLERSLAAGMPLADAEYQTTGADSLGIELTLGLDVGDQPCGLLPGPPTLVKKASASRARESFRKA